MSFIINPYRYAAAGFDIVNSVIFNDDDSPTLDRTPSSAGNRRSSTFSFWLKRGNISEQMVFFSAMGSGAIDYFELSSNNTLKLNLSGGTYSYITTRKFRDTHAWYHFVIAFDTANAISTERMKLYINGRQEREFGTYTAIAEDFDLAIANTVEQQWGNYNVSSGIYWDGYLAEVCFVDGSTLGPDSFGEFNSNGVWVPKKPAVTYGTTGYRLDFADSSDLGNDVSGNNNDFTANNFASTDQSTDTPTLVYPTHASNYGRYVTNDGGGTVHSEGNRRVSKTGSNFSISELNSIPLSSGKYYCCYKPDTVYNINGELGIMPRFAREKTVDYYYDYTDDGILLGMELTTKMNLQGSGITNVMVNWPITPENNADLLVMAIDFDAGTNGKMWCGIYDDSADELFWYKASAAEWSDANEDIPATGSNETLALPTGDGWMFYTRNYASRGSILGFGSGNVLSEFTAPSGFKQINSDNITTPTIPDPTAGFQAITYLGTGANQTITMGGNSYGHRLGSGDRSKLIIVSVTGGSTFQSDYEELVNGSYGTTDGFGYSGFATDMEIRFQFPEAVNITEIIIHRQSAGGNMGDSWVFEATNDTSGSWTAISGAKDFSSAPETDVVSMNLIGANDAYIYYRCRNTNGNGVNSTMWNEFDFRVKPTDNDRAVSTFQPDFVMIKNRDTTDEWSIYDAPRGVTKHLNTSNATETTDADTLTAFNSTGFALGDDDKVNTAGERYLAYCWRAGGGAGSSNTTGSINTTSTTVDQTYGFSISTYEGNATSGATFGHGLGKAPEMVWIKPRDAGEGWTVYHVGLGGTIGTYLNMTNTSFAGSYYWNDTAPSSTVVTLGNHVLNNGSGNNMVAYCWAPIEGFSHFGKYIGNGSANGTVTYTGFKPAFVLIKNNSSAGSWYVYDSTRSPFNEVDDQLVFESTTAETTGSEEIDFLSNGFKCRTTDAGINSGGSTYLYAAFASHPTWGGEDGAPATAV